MKNIYLAGPLFTVADRTHNLRLAKELENVGYRVILPQSEATKFVTKEGFNLTGIALDCAHHASNPENILVANIDGPDADSGTAVEYGLAIRSTGRAIVYRTDLRTYPEKEAGLNAMLNLPGTVFIHLPCFASTTHEIEIFYQKLANEINSSIKGI